ncbi:reverse transcriptase domain-containing protein [Tanacetum coccineum]
MTSPTRGGDPEGQDDREGTPPLTKEQIEGHISAMKSIIKEHNKRNKANPIRRNLRDGHEIAMRCASSSARRIDEMMKCLDEFVKGEEAIRLADSLRWEESRRHFIVDFLFWQGQGSSHEDCFQVERRQNRNPPVSEVVEACLVKAGSMWDEGSSVKSVRTLLREHSEKVKSVSGKLEPICGFAEGASRPIWSPWRKNLEGCTEQLETRLKGNIGGVRLEPAGHDWGTLGKRSSSTSQCKPSSICMSEGEEPFSPEQKRWAFTKGKYKCFLDAYKGYHQNPKAKEDEENRQAFYNGSMRTLIIGRNLEAYVDDMVIKSKEETSLLADIAETFEGLKTINMKLNPKKCSFGVEEGKFLGYMVTSEGIRANPKKTKAISDLQSPKTLKEMQSLSGKLASLNRFLAKSAERALPFFNTLKNITKENKHEYRWTTEAEEAFQQMKRLIMSLPSLTPPFPEETLYAYLAVSREAVSAVLLTDRNGRQCPVQYVSRTLNGQRKKRNYSPLEKLALSLVNMTRRLRRYFEAHPVKVITDQPIKNILSRTEASGKLAKYAVEIGTYKISFIPRNAVKGQVLADFLSDAPDGEREDEYFQSPEVSPGIDDTEAWTLYTDGAASSKGSGAGLILTGPSGVEYAIGLRLTFAAQ